MQHAHHACIQRWIHERPHRGASKACEICGQPFRGSWQDPPLRTGEDPMQLSWQGLVRYALWGGPEGGAGAAAAEAAEWAPLPGPGERRRGGVGSSAAWGATLLLTLFSFLLIRHLIRIVPVTGGRWQRRGRAAGTGACAAPSVLRCLREDLWSL